MASGTYTIVAGQGIGDCRIGSDRQTAIAVFGTPTQADADTSEFLHFPSGGVEVSCDESGKIKVIFAYFRSTSHSAFKGNTDLGIGIDSTVDDVLSRYGKPGQLSEFTESRTKDISYNSIGITFSFADDKLVDIRVYEPRAETWSNEWPMRPVTPDCYWMVFAGEQWMTPAMHAQASFLEFARIADLERFRILPTFENVSIKAFFESTPNNPMIGEHIYLTNIFTNGKTVTATLNASAFRRSDLKEGQEITFPIEWLSDWFLVRSGRGVGGFTIPNVLAEISDEERAQAIDSPPFNWFSHRNGTAEEELLALPECIKCKQRNLMVEQNFPEGVCGICQEGGQRCDCPKCGAPLIRYAKLPDLCSRCIATKSTRPWWRFWG